MEDFDMSPQSIDGPSSEAAGMSTEVMIITSVIVLCFVLAFCFFIHLYAKCYWSGYSEDPNIVSWRRRIARGRPQPSAVAHRRGLDPTALQSLPAVVYDPKDFKEGLECAVCLSEVSQGEKARLLPKCNHGFHVECIDMWFKSHSTCPLCRNSVISDDTNSNINVEDDGLYSSDSSSESDNDHNDDDDSYNGSPRAVESLVYPTNVLFWGNETQVRSFGQAENDAASSSGVNRPTGHDEMVIDIPPISHHEFCEDCSSSPPTQEQAKTPVVTRLSSLKRWLSLGKRVAVAPSPRGSSSCEVNNQDQQV